MLTRFLSRLRRIAPVARPTQKVRPRGLTLEALESREVPAIIYALNGTPGSNNTLLRLDSATPGTIISTTPVTGLGAGETLQGIDYRPRTGQLVGITFPAASTGSNAAKTYTINPLTGAATLVGTSTAITNGSDSVSSDIDFNPTVDRLRYVSEALANARLNPNNGALAANDTAISPNTTVLIGAAYDRDFDRSGSTIPTTLYAIDRNTGTLGTIGSINSTTSPNGGVFTAIGSLGFTLNATNEGGFDIAVSPSSALNNGGLGVAYAVLTASDNVTRLYSINLTTGAATALGALGAGTAEIFDIAIVPDSVTVVGSGAGATGDVRILDASTGAIRTAISNPFPGFQGGVKVAAGDVTGDGVADAIAAAVFAQGNVRVFDGATGQAVSGFLGSFFAFPNFQGTVNVAAGDVNGDGYDDVLVVANGANGAVKAFSGKPSDGGALLASFLTYSGFLGNVTIAAGDFDNDGVAEIVTTAAINGHTKVFKADGTAFTAASLPSFQNSFFAFSPYLGNVSLAVGDVTGDGIADFVLSSGAGVPVNVRVVNGATGSTVSSFIASGLGTNYTGGATVGVSDFNGDGRYDLVVAPNSGTQATVIAYDSLGLTLGTYPAFANFQGGASVAGARF